MKAIVINMATPLPFLLKSLLISILLGLSLIAASTMDGHRPPVVPYNPSATLVDIAKGGPIQETIPDTQKASLMTIIPVTQTMTPLPTGQSFERGAYISPYKDVKNLAFRLAILTGIATAVATGYDFYQAGGDLNHLLSVRAIIAGAGQSILTRFATGTLSSILFLFGNVVLLHAAIAVPVITVSVASKTALCNSYCSINNAKKAAPLLFPLNTPLNDDPAQKKATENAIWCLKYCPISTTQRYTCQLINGMNPKTQDIKAFSEVLAMNHIPILQGLSSTDVPMHIYYRSKLAWFISKNKSAGTDPSQPNFCLNHKDVHIAENEKETFVSKYQTILNEHNTWIALSKDPFYTCATHLFKKQYAATRKSMLIRSGHDASETNGAYNKTRTLGDTMHPFQKNAFLSDYDQFLKDLETYYQRREQNDPALTKILASRWTINKITGFWQDHFCLNIIRYLRQKQVEDQNTPPTPEKQQKQNEISAFFKREYQNIKDDFTYINQQFKRLYTYATQTQNTSTPLEKKSP